MMTNKKKSTSEEAPILRQDYGTTPEVKSEAEMLFGMIGEWDKPVKRPKNPRTDRRLRRLIEEANRNGDCIINDGAGYYRPRPGDGFDEHCFNIYKAKELARARAITDKIKAMEKVFYGGTN